MKRAMTIFGLVTLGIILTHIATGLTEFTFSYSISKYVGLSEVSSIVFLVANTLVAYLVWHELDKRLTNKILRVLIGFILVCLVGLSMCPYGFYDYVVPKPVIFGRTPITLLHMIFSRTMFVLMAVFSGYNFYLNDIKRKYKRPATKISLLFVVYAALVMVLYLFFPEFFWTIDFILESVYILFFFIVLLTI